MREGPVNVALAALVAATQQGAGAASHFSSASALRPERGRESWDPSETRAIACLLLRRGSSICWVSSFFPCLRSC